MMSSSKDLPSDNNVLEERYQDREDHDHYKLANSLKRRENLNNSFKVEDRPKDLILLERIFSSLYKEEIINSSHLDNYLSCTSDEYIIEETKSLIKLYPELLDKVKEVYEEILYSCKLCGYSKGFILKLKELF